MSSTLTASQSASTLVKLMESMGLSVGEFWPWIVWFVFVVVLLFGSLYWAWQKKPIFGVILCSTCFAIICVVPYFIIDKEIERSGIANWMRGMGLFAGAFFAAPVGLYLAYMRTGTLGRQTQNEGKRIIVEEFNRSIKLLGGRQESVRQGGIYALGRLAKENEEMRDTIIRIICSFVRGAGKKGIAQNGTDVEAALYVIKKRNEDESRFDMSNAKIKNGDLSDARLNSFILSDIKANGCIFEGTNFGPIDDRDSNDQKCRGAILNSAKFEGNCDFKNAILEKVDLKGAKFGGDCNFQNTNFRGAMLNSATFGGGRYFTKQEDRKGAQFDNCNFKDATFDNAYLKGAKFSGDCSFENAKFDQAKVGNADFRECKLSQPQVDAMRGNKETKLPSYVNPPAWNK